jgi:transcriptional regulator with XRE-family HTH domain
LTGKGTVQPAEEQLKRPGGLAERLHGMREAAGLGAGELARHLGWSPSKVSKLQNGQQIPTVADVTEWATACARPGDTEELLDILSQVHAVHWQWRHRLRRGHAAIQQDLGQAVRQAKRIRAVEVAVIPGLLQTPDYARVILTMSCQFHRSSLDEVEPAVTARMKRQEALYDGSRTFEFVFTESVVRRRVGGAQVMLGQLDRLLTLSALDNITLAIIPDDAELSLIPGESFQILDNTAILETWVSEDTLTGEEAAVYGRVADTLIAEAATGDAARRLITSAIDWWRSQPSHGSKG